MNRRDFLKMLSALFSLPLVPFILNAPDEIEADGFQPDMIVKWDGTNPSTIIEVAWTPDKIVDFDTEGFTIRV